MVDTLPAEALEAERGLLGALLNRPADLPAARLMLDGSEFYREFHAVLYAVMCDLADAHVAPDVNAVVAELAKRRKLGADGQASSYVFGLWQSAPAGTGVRYHVAAIRDAAKVRAVQRVHTTLGQLLEQHAENGDTDALLDHAAQQSIALTLAADDPGSDAPVPGVATWEDFTTATASPRWIVPGLIRRHDTIMILGAAGAGKSFLSRQVAMCLAAGVHPFKLGPIEPVRTLLVDLENAPDQTAEESGPMLGQVNRLGHTEGRGFVWPHPEGLNLRQRADAALLERVIVQTEPDVLCMGSLYNAYRRGRDDWDTAAEDVQAVLKRLRSRYGLGLWLEHHMPRQQGSGHTGTPYGGTMWERWPTHGRWLRRVAEKTPIFALEQTFRGDRGERDLPAGLTRGGRLPWSAVWDREELDMLIEAAK